MAIQVVERPKSPPEGGTRVYRGIVRDTPLIQAELELDHPYNQTWFQYVDVRGLDLTLPTIEEARRFARLFNQLDPLHEYEIIEAVKGGAPSQVPSAEFLGYDLAYGVGNSLLSWGLEISSPNLDDLKPDDKLFVLQPLLRLVQTYFQPQFNRHGLFSDFETAEFCLACLLALQEIRPNMFENPGVKFATTGVWLIPIE